MTNFKLKNTAFGDVEISVLSENSILLTWSEVIDESQHARITRCENTLKKHLANDLLESIVSYNSLIIYYDFISLPLKALLLKIENLIKTANSDANQNATPSTTIEIPVYYGKDAGWDLASVAKQTQLALDEVIRLHSQTTYRAYALGFTPGFCYLATLPEQLQLPRLSIPRTRVPKGAVAIAGQQSAIYPDASPGGWHILGQTPIAMYQNNGDTFQSTINVGDIVRFIPISKQEFISLGGEVAIND